MDITIKKLNESFMFVDAEASIIQELSELLTFDVPNAKYSPAFKKKHWDGKIRLFNKRNGTLYLGLSHYIEDYAKENEYSIQKDFCDNTFTMDDFKSHIENTNYHNENKELLDLREFQFEAIKHGITNNRAIFLSPTGCHAPGTKVLLFDGSFKPVEDIEIGDVLMGPDNKPRNVLRLFSGSDDMYEIIPKKGEPFVVNKNHILSLVKTNEGPEDKNKPEKIINISVSDYLEKNQTFKPIYKLYRSQLPLTFENETLLLPIEPYFLGVLLGDGGLATKSMVNVTTMDQEIVDEIMKQAKIFDLCVRKAQKQNNKASTYCFAGQNSKQRNIALNKNCNECFIELSKMNRSCRGFCKNCYARLRKQRPDWKRIFDNHLLYTLRDLNLLPIACVDRFIPKQYKLSSIENRLELLAGLIDTDGSLTNSSYYEYVSKSPKLKNDVAFIARSLGFYVSIKEKIINNCIYYRLHICGDIWRIPVKINRKKIASSDKICNVQRSGFDIVSKGMGAYYGFELDSDHLYLLEDFTITHNSGKSLMIYSLLKFYYENTDKKILIICPTTALVEQLYTDFIEYSNNTLDIENNTCRIYSGTERFNDRRIVISTWQSLYEKDSDYFDEFETVIADECHLYKSKQTSKLFEKCLNVKFRFGFTGTLSGENIHQLQLEGLFGKAIQLTTTSKMMAAKQLNEFKIKAVVLKYSNKTIKANKKNIWEEEVQFLIGNKKRNAFIAGLAKELKGNSLILFSRVETHGMLIYEEIKKLVGEERVKFIYGGTEVEIREQIRKCISVDTNIILVASSQIFSTGTNIPALTNIVFTHPSKARIRILQSIGRALRKNKNKTCSFLWDIADDLRSKTTENYSYRHFKERLELYSTEEFDYTIKNYILEKEENE